MSDQDLTLQIRGLLAALIADFDAVKVEVEAGIAYLEGVATSLAERERIEQLVARVAGIKQVVNCVAVEHVAQFGHYCELAGFPEQEPYFLAMSKFYTFS